MVLVSQLKMFGIKLKWKDSTRWVSERSLQVGLQEINRFVHEWQAHITVILVPLEQFECWNHLFVLEVCLIKFYWKYTKWWTFLKMRQIFCRDNWVANIGINEKLHVFLLKMFSQKKLKKTHWISQLKMKYRNNFSNIH